MGSVFEVDLEALQNLLSRLHQTRQDFESLHYNLEQACAFFDASFIGKDKSQFEQAYNALSTYAKLYVATIEELELGTSHLLDATLAADQVSLLG